MGPKSAWETGGSADEGYFVTISGPVLRLLHVLGLDYYPHESSAGNSSRFRWFVAFTALAFHFQAAVVLWYFYIPKAGTDCDSCKNTTHSFNDVVDRLNFAFTNLLIHLSARYLGARRMGRLWEKIRRVEQEIPFEAETFKRLRRFCIGALVIGVCIVQLEAAIDLWLSFEAALSWLEIVQWSIIHQMHLYSMATTTIFVCWARILSTAFENLANLLRLKGFRDFRSFERKFTAVCQATECLYEIFSFILLLTTVQVFIGFINCSYAFFMHHGNSYTIRSVVLFILLELITTFGLICHAPDRIYAKARSIIPLLQTVQEVTSISTCIVEDRGQIQPFLLEICQTSPTLNIFGLFSLSKTLLVTLVGTTMTYLIVLCQFSTSENTINRNSSIFN